MYKALLVSILAIAVPGGRHARQPAPAAVPDETCANVKFETPSGQTLPPDPQLTPSEHPIGVEVHFTATYRGKNSKPLSPQQRSDVCEAARRFAVVWSSTQFRDEVTNYHGDFIAGNLSGSQDNRPIAGKDLIVSLTSQSTIVMSVSGSTLMNPTGLTGCAATWPFTNETLLDERYLAGHRPKCGLSDRLIIALTNTLSHEYTHYKGSLGPGLYSTDSAYKKVDAPSYVSYGIGCITQKLAFPGTRCLTDPKQGPAVAGSPNVPKSTNP